MKEGDRGGVGEGRGESKGEEEEEEEEEIMKEKKSNYINIHIRKICCSRNKNCGCGHRAYPISLLFQNSALCPL
jgi:hypothetical protein